LVPLAGPFSFKPPSSLVLFNSVSSCTHERESWGRGRGRGRKRLSFPNLHGEVLFLALMLKEVILHA
jgi:hypothetical protein